MQMWKNTKTDMWYFEIPMPNIEPTVKKYLKTNTNFKYQH